MVKVLNFFFKVASAVASATMTPLNVEASPNRLLELVAKVIPFFFMVPSLFHICCFNDHENRVLQRRTTGH